MDSSQTNATRPQTQPTAEQYKQWQQMYGQTAQAQTAWAQQQQFMASYYSMAATPYTAAYAQYGQHYGVPATGYGAAPGAWGIQYTGARTASAPVQPSTAQTSTIQSSATSAPAAKRAKVSTPTSQYQPSNSTPTPQPSSQQSQHFQNSASSKNQAQWPDSLKRYVERVFDHYKSEEERAAIQDLLKQMITKAIEQNTLYTTDWDKKPILTLPTPSEPKTKLSDKLEKRLAKACVNKLNEQEQKSTTKLLQRTQRFAQPQVSVSSRPMFTNDQDASWYTGGTISGTSTALEKPYLRLTAPPDPSTVRPEPILKKALEHVKRKVMEGAPWDYACEQLKSIRQDLTVQRIKNEFTVEVYETHARLCLENGDLGEYNQCQGQLRHLYAQGIKGNYLEFTAYALLYTIYSNNPADLAHILAELPADVRKAPPIAHAFKVGEAVRSNNWHNFFKLYKTAPNMGQYIMEFMFDKVRFSALKAWAAAIRPDLPLSFIQEELAFNSKDEMLSFLKERNAVLLPDGSLDCKASQSNFRQYEESLG